jgi:hypothetical protein
MLDRLWLLLTMLGFGWLCVWVALSQERTQRQWWPFTMRVADAGVEKHPGRPSAMQLSRVRTKVNAFGPTPSAPRNRSDGRS